MSFSKHNMYVTIVVAILILYITLFYNKFAIYDSYLGRSLLAIIIILLTYYNTWLGIVAVIAIFFMSSSSTSLNPLLKESFINVEQLFDQQNHLQKKVYYIPKRKEAPVPQNDTDFVPLNPMQSKAGAIQPSQPAPISIVQPNRQKTTGNNYHNLLRLEDNVRPKSSKTIGSDMGRQWGLNRDFEPDSNWPDGNAFKNPYSAAEE